jgi:hypothetical protein
MALALPLPRHDPDLAEFTDGEPLLLDALEPDQLVATRRRYGRRHLSGPTRALMWGLRAYVVLALAVVAERVAHAVAGG